MDAAWQPQQGRINWLKYSSPQTFFPLAGKMTPWFAGAALIFCVLGFYIGLLVAPTDQQQGDAYRIIFIHVGAAWMSMFLYLVMAFWAGVGLVFNTRLSGMMATALAPTGALFTFIALWTGSLWGKPVWGEWWIWDVRLIAELVLLLIYLAIIAIHATSGEPRSADRIAGIVALLGAAIVPVNLMSVAFWPRLHQNPSLILSGPSGTAVTVVAGLLAMAVGFWMYGTAAVLARLRCVILERERHSDWVTQCSRGNAA